MESTSTNPDLPTSTKNLVPPTEDQEIKEVSPKKELDPDSLFQEGMILLKDNKTEESIDSFCKALELATKVRGDLHESLYKFYYAYADALILQYEKEHEGDVFGEAVPQQVECSDSESGSESVEDTEKGPENQLTTENKESKDHPKDFIEEREGSNSESEEGSEESGESEESEGQNEENTAKNLENTEENAGKNEETGKKSQNPEESDDLQIAWESLDTSRVILNKLNPPDYYSLFKVQSRLGDLQSYKEQFESACEEYFAALNTLKRLEGLKPSREQASIHYLIGQNFLYSKNKESEAAEHFKQSYAILDSVLLTNPDPDTVQELKAAMEDLKLKIEDAFEQKESVRALKDLEGTQMDQFDPPQVTEVVDLGVVSRRRLQPQGDPEFPDGNDDKKRVE